jgi:hypothetical protein
MPATRNLCYLSAYPKRGIGLIVAENRLSAVATVHEAVNRAGHEGASR